MKMKVEVYHYDDNEIKKTEKDLEKSMNKSGVIQSHLCYARKRKFVWGASVTIPLMVANAAYERKVKKEKSDKEL